MNSRGIAELYQVVVLTANEHIKTIHGNRELDAWAVNRNFRIVQIDLTGRVVRQLFYPKEFSYGR